MNYPVIQYISCNEFIYIILILYLLLKWTKKKKTKRNKDEKDNYIIAHILSKLNIIPYALLEVYEPGRKKQC